MREKARTKEQSFYSLPPFIRTIVYKTAIQYGKEEYWQFLYDKMLKEQNQAEFSRILDAIVYTNEPWAVKT